MSRFGTTARNLALLALVSFAGCKSGALQGIINQFMPKVKFQDLKVKKIDFKGVETDFVFAVENPNPIKVKLASFAYDLDLGGQNFLSGDQTEGLSLEPRGDSQLVLPVGTNFKDLIALVGGVKAKDGVPFAFAGDIGFGTPLGPVKVPFKKEGDFPVLQVPKINVKGVRLGKVTPLPPTATINIDLGVAHSGGSKMDFKNFDYALKLGGRPILDGMIQQLASVDPGAQETVSLPVTLKLLEVGATVFESITKKKKVDVGLDANLGVGTPFGVIPLHIDETGKLQIQ